MKQLITAITLVLLVFLLWSCFFINASSRTQVVNTQIKEEILPLIKGNNFQLAKAKLYNMKKNINILVKIYSFYIDTQQLTQLQDTFERTLEFVQAKDVSNSSGEIQSFRCQLINIYLQQKPTIENIF